MFEKYKPFEDKFAPVEKTRGEKPRVYVSEDGQVLTYKQGILPTGQNHRGELVATVELWGERKEYLVSLLSLIAYGKLKLPKEYHHLVEPFHIDTNVLNLHPSNIGYRYITPIESRRYPGYYFVPMMNDYIINRDGIVIRRRDGRVVNPYVIRPTASKNRKNIKGGYVTFSLTGDVGQTTIGRHRALALTFLPYPHYVDRLDVNHKDGVPGNDWLSNLEWVTRRENNIHAVKAGLRTQNIPCYAKNVHNGMEKEFFSFADAARYFNTDTRTIADRLAVDDQKLYTGGWLFKLDRKTPWREVEDTHKELKVLPSGVRVYSKNIFTGDVRLHESVAHCGRELPGLKHEQGPKHQLRNGRNQPYYGYLFKYESDNTPWPVYTPEQLAHYRSNGTGRARGVIARHQDGTILKFGNIKEACEHFDCLRRTTDVCKAIERKRNVNGYTLSYVN